MAFDLAAERMQLKAAARLLGVHPATIWRWTLTGVRGRKLPTIWIGARRWVLRRDLEAFVGADTPGRTKQAEQPQVEAELDRMLTNTKTQPGVLRTCKRKAVSQ